MKILIVGASGQVGKTLFLKFKSLGHDVIGTKVRSSGDLASLDIRDASSVKMLVSKLKPECVVLAAALTNVDYCEENKDEAKETNVDGTRNVVEACRGIGAKLVFMSTDYVFDGKDGPYSEDAKPNPISYYAKTKLDGENMVKTLPNYLIVRTTWVFDYGGGDRNFAARVISELRKGNVFKVPTDQVANPTLASNLADVVAELVVNGKSGIYNVSGTTRVSKYEFALKIAEKLGLDKHLIKGIETVSLVQKAKRPLNAGLKTFKVQADVSTKLLNLDEMLDILKKKVENNE